MKKGKKIPKKQSGGYLNGPSHEEGGIIASTNGEEVELEGGEYIINAQTVDALGTEFLDKINSTATTYHDGGFGQGELPNPSQYRTGGQIRRNNMRRSRKFGYGGSTMSRSSSNMNMNNRMRSSSGMNPYSYNRNRLMNPYRKGGGIKKYYGGGSMRNGNQDNMMTSMNQFINRRTGQTVPAGMPYHIHPDKGPIAGAVHNDNIPGGTAGHDYYDPMMRHGGYHAIPGTGGPGMPPPSIPNIMSRRGSMGMSGGNQVQSTHFPCVSDQDCHGGMVCIRGMCGYRVVAPKPGPIIVRKGGPVRSKYAHGGMHRNGECAPGEMCHGGYHNGMRRGGPVRRRYAHGGYHSNGNENGINAGSPNSCIDGMGRNVPC